MSNGISAIDAAIISVNQGQLAQPDGLRQKLRKMRWPKGAKHLVDLNNCGIQGDNPSVNPPHQHSHVGLADKTLRDSNQIKQGNADFIPKPPEPTTESQHSALERTGSQAIADTLARDNVLAQFESLQLTIQKLRQERDKAKSEHERLNTINKELTSDLEKKTLEMRQAQVASESEKAKWQHRAETEENLERRIGDLNTQLHDQMTQLQSAKSERDRLKPFEEDFNGLQSNFNATFDKLAQTNTQLEKVQGLYEQIQIHHAAASNELNRMKLESRSMLDDVYFTTKWKDLQSDIKQWAENYFWVESKRMWTVQFPHNHPNISVDLLALSGDCKDLMTAEGGAGRPIMAEAYLWKFIEETVLDGNPSSYSKGFFWAHTLRSEFCRMEEFLRPDKRSKDLEQRMFYKWKASTAKLLIARLMSSAERGRVPIDPAIFKFLNDRVLKVLGPWLTSDEGTFRRDLERIFQSVIDLDSHMNEQFSFMYAVSVPHEYMGRHGFPFDNAKMEAIRNDIQMVDGQPVGIIVSPALVRSGTANGDEYNRTLVLVKSKVMPQGFLSSSLKPKNSKYRTGIVTESVHKR